MGNWELDTSGQLYPGRSGAEGFEVLKIEASDDGGGEGVREAGSGILKGSRGGSSASSEESGIELPSVLEDCGGGTLSFDFPTLFAFDCAEGAGLSTT